MDTETLDRLLMDREMGALSEDARDLLEAYLRHDAGAAARARAFAEVGDLARRALSREAPSAMPTFPRDRLRRDRVSRRRWRVVGRAAALAACLVFGVWLGSVNAPHPMGGSGQAPSVLVESPPGPSAGEASSDDTRFWSARRLYRDAVGAKSNRAKKFIWESPVTKPRRGGAV